MQDQFSEAQFRRDEPPTHALKWARTPVEPHIQNKARIWTKGKIDIWVPCQQDVSGEREIEVEPWVYSSFEGLNAYLIWAYSPDFGLIW